MAQKSVIKFFNNNILLLYVFVFFKKNSFGACSFEIFFQYFFVIYMCVNKYTYLDDISKIFLIFIHVMRNHASRGIALFI